MSQNTHNGHGNGNNRTSNQPGGMGQSELNCNNLFDVNGQVAVVTGGSSGLGSMLARALVSNGCKVYLVSRRTESLQRVCKDFESNERARCHSDAKLIPIQADLSSKEGCEKLKKELEKAEQSIDILINAAKISGHPVEMAGNDLRSIEQALWQVNQHDADAIFRTNVVGLYFTIAALLPLLGRSKHHPQIINVAGVGAFRRDAVAGILDPASMSAVIHLTKNMANLLARTNVRCNAISPVPGAEHRSNDSHSSGMTKQMMSNIPAGRAGNEKDIGALILFLASKHQSYVSGSIIPIDGGMLNVVPSCY